jgi:hypothetical protein
MFNFDEEIEKYDDANNQGKCKLCRGTGKYFIHNRNIYYTCYGCDAHDKLNPDGEEDKKEKS